MLKITFQNVVLPQVKSFKFSNCGKSSDPINVSSLELGPDPVKIPGNITVAVQAKVGQDLKAPIKVLFHPHAKWITV